LRKPLESRPRHLGLPVRTGNHNLRRTELHSLRIGPDWVAVCGLGENSIQSDRHHHEEDSEKNTRILHPPAQDKTRRRKRDQERDEDQTTRTEHHPTPPGANENIPRNLVANFLYIGQWWRLH